MPATRADLLALAALRRAKAAKGIALAKAERGQAGRDGRDGQDGRQGAPGAPGKTIERVIERKVESLDPWPRAERLIERKLVAIREEIEKAREAKKKAGSGPVLQMRAFQRVPSNLALAHFNPDGTITFTFNDGNTLTSDNAAAGASSTFATRTVTGSTTALPADDLIIVNSASAAVVTLMASSGRTRPLYIKRLGAGSVDVQAAGADLIDGQAVVTITTQYTTLQLAQGWYIV